MALSSWTCSNRQKKGPARRQTPGPVINTRKRSMSMIRIVDGIVYDGKPADSRFRVLLRDLGHGHREASVNRCVDWVEVGPLHPDSRAAQVLRGEIEDPDAEEKREANTFVALAEAGREKEDDLLQRVTVRRLAAWIRGSRLTLLREDRYVTGFFRRALPGPLRRPLERAPFAQDVMIGHIQCVLRKA